MFNVKIWKKVTCLIAKLNFFKGFNAKHLFLLLNNLNEWTIFVDWDILEWHFYLLSFAIKKSLKVYKQLHDDLDH